MERMLVFLGMVWGCWALSFHLPPETQKCLKEELHQDLMVSSHYEISPGIRIDLRVTDSSGRLLYSKEDAKKGKLSFITEDEDVYEICFRSHRQPGNSKASDPLVTLGIKRGAEARDYEEVAKAAKLKPLEVDLRRTEDLSGAIAKDFASAKGRKMDAKESIQTHAFVRFGISSMIVLSGLAIWQVFPLKRLSKPQKPMA